MSSRNALLLPLSNYCTVKIPAFFFLFSLSCGVCVCLPSHPFQALISLTPQVLKKRRRNIFPLLRKLLKCQ